MPIEQIDLFSIDLFPATPIQEVKSEEKKKPTVLQLVKQAIRELGKPSTLTEIYNKVKQLCFERKVKPPENHSIRARIYESTELKPVARGVHWFATAEKNHVLVIEGDGRDLSLVPDSSVDAILTDHPYYLESHKGGNRNMTEGYETFLYNENDLQEQARTMKDEAVMVQFLAEICTKQVLKYANKMVDMAEKAGLFLYSIVNWVKEGTSNNQGRKKKNMEAILFFTKGKCRSLRPDMKKIKSLGGDHRLAMLKMLPTAFVHPQTHISKRRHKAEKPISLLSDILSYIALPGETVLDMFGGSGNIIPAALEQGCHAIVIEKDPAYANGIACLASEYTDHVFTLQAD